MRWQSLCNGLGCGFWSSALGAAIFLLAYIALGGLTATIYNEVLQFALIVAGLAPLVYLILREFHGIGGLTSRLPPNLSHTWKGLPFFQPAGSSIDVFGSVFGLTFVLSAGYWCTDFLLVQRASALETLVYNSGALRAAVRSRAPWLLAAGIAAICIFLNWRFW